MHTNCLKKIQQIKQNTRKKYTKLYIQIMGILRKVKPFKGV